MPLSLITPPEAEPLDLDAVKDQCRIGRDASDQDALLSSYIIPAARERAESQTGRALLTQTWDLVLDVFPDEGYIEIPKPPLIRVDSLKYQDQAGVVQTWAASHYVVQAPAGPRCQCGRLALAYGMTWPTTLGEIGDVVVRFTCGWETEGDVPGLIKMAMLMDAATLYANPETIVKGAGVVQLPGGVRDIYWFYRAHARQRRCA